MTDSITVAVVGGLFGLLSALVGAWFAYRISRRKRADDLFSTALEFLGGGTQRRNLGIAAISLYRRQFPEYEDLCTEMLIGSAIYLLAESEQKDKTHELYNLHKIMGLLIEMLGDIKKENFKRSDRYESKVAGYKRLRAVLDVRINSNTLQPPRGLWLTNKSELQTWRRKLENDEPEDLEK